jgi:hypothetical protein
MLRAFSSSGLGLGLVLVPPEFQHALPTPAIVIIMACGVALLLCGLGLFFKSR